MQGLGISLHSRPPLLSISGNTVNKEKQECVSVFQNEPASRRQTTHTFTISGFPVALMRMQTETCQHAHRLSLLICHPRLPVQVVITETH